MRHANGKAVGGLHCVHTTLEEREDSLYRNRTVRRTILEHGLHPGYQCTTYSVLQFLLEASGYSLHHLHTYRCSESCDLCHGFHDKRTSTKFNCDVRGGGYNPPATIRGNPQDIHGVWMAHFLEA